MRTLYEIIEAAKDGRMPTLEECYWAMLALDALATFDRMAIRRVAQLHRGSSNRRVGFIEREHSDSFNRIKKALGKSPAEWVGWRNDPSNPEYQKRRKAAIALCRRVEKQELGKLRSIVTGD